MYHTMLQKKESIAEGTMRFYFAKPEGFSFLAGQTMDVTLPDPKETDAEGNSRTFSIVAAPQDELLSIATRMRDTAFKRCLRDLPEGSAIDLDGPFGSFTLHEKAERPAVFILGGIGITPFRSIIADATARQLPHEITLFYSNKRPEDAAFLSELQDFEKRNDRFTLVATMTNMEESKVEWNGARGYIDAAMVKAHVSLEAQPIFYLAGPAGMVKAMRELLNGMGVSNDDIRTEEFAGY